MENDEYECAWCHGIFKLIRDETWSEEKANEEYIENFPYSSMEDREVVCEECWQVVRPD
jgi:DNA-directed RNA polymerase subunit RPC12/RpoP